MRTVLIASLLLGGLALSYVGGGRAASGASGPSGTPWHPDLDAALEVARAEGKDLLVDFTGSDWCGWCHRLDGEVFTQEAFLAPAAAAYVLVALDFPRPGGAVEAAMSPELRARNAAHRDALGVHGYPTVMLLTPEGVVYGRTGYQPGGAGAYLEHLRAFGAQREDVARLLADVASPAASPDARLAAAHALVGRTLPARRRPLLDVIAAHDPQDERGVLASAALADFARVHLQVEAPDWVAVSDGLAALALERPSVTAQPDYHLWMGVALGQQGRAERALAHLVEARDGGGMSEDAFVEAQRLAGLVDADGRARAGR